MSTVNSIEDDRYEKVIKPDTYLCWGGNLYYVVALEVDEEGVRYIHVENCKTERIFRLQVDLMIKGMREVIPA